MWDAKLVGGLFWWSLCSTCSEMRAGRRISVGLCGLGFCGSKQCGIRNITIIGIGSTQLFVWSRKSVIAEGKMERREMTESDTVFASQEQALIARFASSPVQSATEQSPSLAFDPH